MGEKLSSDSSLRFTSVLPWLKTVPISRKACGVVVKATDFEVWIQPPYEQTFQVLLILLCLNSSFINKSNIIAVRKGSQGTFRL